MKTPKTKTAPAAAQAGAAGANETPDAQPAAPAAGDGTAAQSALAAAATVPVSLKVVRRLGSEAAVVLAVIQSGTTDYVGIVHTTGLSHRDVRTAWYRLAQAGHQLPENTPKVRAMGGDATP